MSGDLLEYKKDKRLLVLFAFGLLLLCYDFIPFSQLRLGAASRGCQLSGDDDHWRGGNVDTVDNSAVISPRLAFFLNRPMAINRASIQDLVLLPGIGEQLAGRIVKFRAENGEIADASDLEQIAGIGRKMSRKISRFVTFLQP